MPYRIDLRHAPDHALDTLVDLGALDIESTGDSLAALLPDAVAPDHLAIALGVDDFRISPAVARDDGSVWMLSPRPVQTRTLTIVPAGWPAPPTALRLLDGPAFGTGLHPTTALCLGTLEELIERDRPERLLDVGTGSGILALAALRCGVARATGVEIDAPALRVAAENARLNGLADRLSLVLGSLDAVRGAWPLVVANIRAAELMEMAPALARRVASRGRLVLSGIPQAVASQVEQTYRRLGMTQVGGESRGGWTSLVVRPSW